MCTFLKKKKRFNGFIYVELKKVLKNRIQQSQTIIATPPLLPCV